jgi:two-component system NarL family response regulator
MTQPSSKPHRILIVDDHLPVRMGLAALIGMQPDLRCVGDAENGADAIEKARQHRPDLVLMDLRMPVMGGVEATLGILQEMPGVRIIVLTTYDNDEDIYRALQAGARAYLLKGLRKEDFLTAIRTVLAGERYIPPPVAARLAERMARPELTPRELETLRLIAKGWSNKEIAAHLSVSEDTVKTHLRALYTKLGVNDRTQAVTTALRQGLIQLE